MSDSYSYSPSSSSYGSGNTQQKKSSLRPVLIATVTSFLLGGAAMFYFSADDDWSVSDVIGIREAEFELGLGSGSERETEAELEAIEQESEPEQVAAEAREAVERVEQVVETQGGLDQRLAAMEQRLTRLDLQAEAATGNVARAESLLIAFATRRAIERGGDLGYLADQLRLRFGDARPNAVQTIINVAQDPITLDQLLSQFDGLTPLLAETPADEGTWARIGREVAQLFVVRKEDTPSPRADRRLDRARVYVETGQIERAVLEVSNVPNADIAEEWVASAKRYAAGQTALEVLETAAILEPHELRDSAGETVDQVSPAASSSGG